MRQHLFLSPEKSEKRNNDKESGEIEKAYPATRDERKLRKNVRGGQDRLRPCSGGDSYRRLSVGQGTGDDEGALAGGEVRNKAGVHSPSGSGGLKRHV